MDAYTPFGSFAAPAPPSTAPAPPANTAGPAPTGPPPPAPTASESALSASPPLQQPPQPAEAPPARPSPPTRSGLGFAPPPPKPTSAAPAPAPAAPSAPAPASTAAQDGPPTPSAKSLAQIRRIGVACTRCRRMKQRCTNDGVPPCQACVARGCEADCTLGEKGRSADDRGPRASAPSRKRRADDGDAAYVDGPSMSSFGASSSGPSSHARRASIASVGEGSPPLPSSGGFVPSAPASAAGKRRTSAGGAGLGLNGSNGVTVKEEPELEDELMDEDEAVVSRPAKEEALPPLPLLVEGCEAFFSTSSQLTFLHRPSFLHTLSTSAANSASGKAPISPFLLFAILGISARFSDGLVRRTGGDAREASEMYAERAMGMVLQETLSPSLERVQALYLLALLDQSNGQLFRAKMLHGLARNMAEALTLHEEKPELSDVENEARLRTWWFLSIDGNFLAASPAPGLDPVTKPVLLPSQETDFAFGIKSRVKQCFPDASDEIREIHPPVAGELSLLGAQAAVLGVFDLIARETAGLTSQYSQHPPGHPSSLVAMAKTALSAVTDLLSPVQQWSTQALLAYRTQNLELAFMGLHVDLATVNLLARRKYLPKAVEALRPVGDAGIKAEKPVTGEVSVAELESKFVGSWMEEMVEQAFRIVELQEEVAALRPGLKGVSPHLSLCTYLAGSILAYLRLYPFLCPSRAALAPVRLSAALSLLHRAAPLWPLVERWHRSLWSMLSSAELGADEAELYRPYAPAGAGAGAASPLDAASALAAMAASASGVVPPASAAQSQNAVKRFSAHLRPAEGATAAAVATPSSLPTPFASPALSLHGSANGTDAAASAAASGANGVNGDEVDQLAEEEPASGFVELGDLEELRRLVEGTA
ncbi:hypothetical protein JCM8097_001771 [Rhodosporidiobolus ruineniae]